MRDTFAADLATARTRGLARLTAFWVVTVGQALWFGIAERRAGAFPSGLRAACTVDWRDAWRALVASPGVTTIAVLSLALGIGANLSLFTIANSLLFKPLPVRDPAELVLFGNDSWTNPIWEQIRDRQYELFDGAFAWSNEQFDPGTTGVKDTVEGAYASGSLFDVLGVPALVGRTFAPRDDVHGGGPDGAVAVISHRLWMRRFGGAPDIAGRSLMVERVPFTIVGVMPPEFFGAEVGRAWDVIVPLGTEPIVKGKDSILDGRLVWWLNMMARRKPGQSFEQALAAVRTAQPQIRRATLPPSNADVYLKDPFELSDAPTGRSTLRARYTQPLGIIMAVVGAVLLIACANLANLLLARASARRRDLSVRLALGAPRARLVRQLLAETLLLAAAGTALGAVLSRWTSELLVAQLSTPRQTPSLDLAVDWRVAVFAVGLALATALVFGVAPALGVSHLSPSDALKEQGRGVAGDRRVSMRNALVVVQVALSLAVVVSAALLLRTFTALAFAPLGFDASHLLVVDVDLQRSTATRETRGEVFAALREAAAATPGVSQLGVSLITPVSGAGWNAPIRIGDPAAASPVAGREPVSWVNAVSPDWFATYGMRFIAGRTLSPRDRRGSPHVVVVNEAFVQEFFRGRNPVGQSIEAGYIVANGSAAFEIVGVVSNAIYRSARAGMAPTLYVPLDQIPSLPPRLGFTIRASAASGPLVRDLGDALVRAEPAAALEFRPMSTLVTATVAQERLLAILSGAFGGLALLLAAIGLYGVTSYSVGRRRTEIGIRMALGANRISVAALVMRRVGWLLASGLVLGAALAAWATRFIGSLLFRLEPDDPRTFAAAALALIAVGLLAGWLPARRAARADPIQALRNP
jgi:putative ABC transport system permease protein